MRVETAKKMQRLLWHLRWGVLVIVMVFTLYSFLNVHLRTYFLPTYGFCAAVYALLKMWEEYFDCRSKCKV